MEHHTPPAYAETQAPPSGYTALNPPQSPGYNHEQIPNVGQSYNVGQGYNVGQSYPVSQPTYLANPGCSQIFYSCQPAATPADYGKYRSRQSIIAGVGQIIIGILCIIFNAVLIGISDTWSLGVIAHGIWGGVLFIVTGAFGVSGGKKKAKCLIVTYMILCILAALAAAVIFILAIIGLVIGSSEYDTHYYYSSYYPYYASNYYRIRPDNYAAAMAMNILLVILSAAVGSLCIWGSTLCCRVSCCAGSQISYVTAAQPVQFQPVSGNQQILFVAQPAPAPQYIPYPGYPMQMAAHAPAYQPPIQSVVGQTNQGFTGEFEKSPVNPNAM